MRNQQFKEGSQKTIKGRAASWLPGFLLPQGRFFPRMALMAADNPHPIRIHPRYQRKNKSELD
jgi:hypothetical protein